MKHLIQLIILALMLTSCQQNNRDQAVYDMAGSEGELVPNAKQVQNTPPPPDNPINPMVTGFSFCR